MASDLEVGRFVIQTHAVPPPDAVVLDILIPRPELL